MFKAREAGRPDLQRRVNDLYAEIAPRLDAIDQEFAEEHGFDFRPRIQGAGGQVGEEGLLASRGLGLDDGPGGRDPNQGNFDFEGGHGPGSSARRSLTATDPEGRNLIARFVAGVREEGGPDVPLSPVKIVQVADAFAWPLAEAKNAGRELSRFVEANMPGRSLWYGRLAMERLIFDELEAAIDPNAAKSFRRIEQGARRDYGQRFWWRPGTTLPRRGPDLGAVGG